jgi:hypothetical protein
MNNYSFNQYYPVTNYHFLRSSSNNTSNSNSTSNNNNNNGISTLTDRSSIIHNTASESNAINHHNYQNFLFLTNSEPSGYSNNNTTNNSQDNNKKYSTGIGLSSNNYRQSSQPQTYHTTTDRSVLNTLSDNVSPDYFSNYDSTPLHQQQQQFYKQSSIVMNPNNYQYNPRSKSVSYY